MTTLSISINNKSYHFDDLDPRTTLLDLCRHHLQITGPKKGCDHGQCGACTILINGQRVNACLTLAVMHDGDEITTIEGIGLPETLSELQIAFKEHDAFQCGYCTPGQICSATALIEEVKQNWPSYVSDNLKEPNALLVNEIAERMSGNVCRCSAYPNIIKAISEVLQKELHQHQMTLDSGSESELSNNQALASKKTLANQKTLVSHLSGITGIWSPSPSQAQLQNESATSQTASQNTGVNS